MLVHFLLLLAMVLPVTNQWQYLPTQVPLLDTNSKYITYYEGSLPLILAAPHGGRLFPTSIPDRKAGNGTVTVTDAYTKDVVLAIAKKIRDRTGESPHVVLLQLARTKVDVNREKSEATDSDAGRMVWQVSLWGRFMKRCK
jgi:N-formylglutamate amidohydrolase